MSIVNITETPKAVAFKHQINIVNVRISYVQYVDEESDYITNIRITGLQDYCNYIRENFGVTKSNNYIIKFWLDLGFDYLYEPDILESYRGIRIDNDMLSRMIVKFNEYSLARQEVGETIIFNN